MAKKLPEYLVYFLQDCLQNNPEISYKPMFWWYGIYKYRKIFAIYVWTGEIYFKVDDTNKQDYLDAHSQPFKYVKKWGKVWIMSYYLLPEEILENREKLENWIDKSLLVESKTKKKSTKNPELDKKILEYLCEIPKWKITSYKYLAEKFWVHPRKIASVMRYNKNPTKYPCYKVLSHNGKLSGYNTDRWVKEKIEKLEADGVSVINNHVDKKYFLK